MGSVNYLLHKDDLTLTKREERRLTALAAGISKCFSKGIGLPSDIPNWVASATPQANVLTVLSYLKGGNWPDSIDVKNMELSVNDLVVGPTLDQWLTAALAAVGTAYSCFQNIAVPQMQDVKLAVFYGVQVNSIPFAVSRLIFRQNGAAGNIQAQFDLEGLEAMETWAGLFSEPVVIEPRQNFAAQVLCRQVTNAAAKIVLENYVFEAKGATIA